MKILIAKAIQWCSLISLICGAISTAGRIPRVKPSTGTTIMGAAIAIKWLAGRAELALKAKLTTVATITTSTGETTAVTITPFPTKTPPPPNSTPPPTS